MPPAYSCPRKAVGMAHNSKFTFCLSAPTATDSPLAEVPRPRQVEHLRRQLQRTALKAANVASALDQVARLARAQLPIVLLVPCQQPLDLFGFDRHALL